VGRWRVPNEHFEDYIFEVCHSKLIIFYFEVCHSKLIIFYFEVRLFEVDYLPFFRSFKINLHSIVIIARRVMSSNRQFVHKNTQKFFCFIFILKFSLNLKTFHHDLLEECNWQLLGDAKKIIF